MVKLCHLSSALVVLIVTQFVPLSAQACNVKGFFGSNCQYHCNCYDEKCNSATGECVADSYCDYGWWGPACQYVDLTTTESNTTSPTWLYDGDDTTCVRNEDLDKVTVQLKEPSPFTWLRLYVDDTGDLYSIQVQFKDDSSHDDDNLVDCYNKRMATPTDDDNSLNIYCDQDSLVQQVILTGEGVRSLCSVYISGGRQVTLRQPTKQSSTASGSNSEMAVDGVTSTESDDCTSTKSGDSYPHWNVTFEQPQAINRFLLIYRQVKNEYITHTLTFYDKEDKQLDQDSRYDESTAATYHKTEIKPVAPVSVINVKVSSAPPFHKPLILCEVLAYGDTVCPQGKYGRECEHSCDTCLNQKCFVATGDCQDGCVDGFVGDQCQTPCEATYYGKNCGERCSTQCVDRLCNNINGVCDQCDAGKTGDQCDEECPPKMHGPNCKLTCSTRCKDQLCHPIYGICLKCPPGYYGDGCNTPCESDHYGHVCEQCDLFTGACIHENVNERTKAPGEQTDAKTMCPQGKYGKKCEHSCDNCFNQKCSVATGDCQDGCVDGFVGERCQTPCSATYYGKNCEKRCSMDCVIRLCDNINGVCNQCNPGKTGDLCDEVCPNNTYGHNCQLSCSPNCIDQLCDPVDGKCNECPPGYSGHTCSNPCPATLYGKNCSERCNIKCLERHCDSINGKCDECVAGKTGDHCNRESSNGRADTIVGNLAGVLSASIVVLLFCYWNCY